MKTKLLISAFLLISCFHLSYGQWTTTYLSAPTIQMGGAVAGEKAYFAGGSVKPGIIWVASKKVEVYNIETGEWRLDSLSVARTWPTGVTCGSKVLFAGGRILGQSGIFSTVDIYDTITGIWTVRNLSVPRFDLSALSNDTLVLFAGGHDVPPSTSFDEVDIYNINTQQWSTQNLSIPRGSMGCAKVGDLAFFAGGTEGLTSWYDRVDIYNFSTDTWDTTSLSQARGFIGACTVGNKVLFAGGMTANGVPTDRVDIYDYATGSWDTASLSQAKGFSTHQVAVVNGKAYFVGGGTFQTGVWITDSDTIDIYDPGTDVWSVMTMPNRLNNHTVLSNDTMLLVAGGSTYNMIPYSNLEIYVVPPLGVGIESYTSDDAFFKVYPNPSSGHVNFEISDVNHNSFIGEVYNLQGQLVFTQTLAQNNGELNLQLPPGVYLLKVISKDVLYSKLITVL